MWNTKTKGVECMTIALKVLLLIAFTCSALDWSFGAENKPASEFLAAVGDAPDLAPPLATDLSPALNQASVQRATLKVADWQLERVEQDFNRDWTFAVLYSGFMAVSENTHNPKYRDAMLAMSKRFHWQLADEYHDANDQAMGRTYLELYLKEHDPNMIAGIQAELDRLRVAPREPPKVQF